MLNDQAVLACEWSEKANRRWITSWRHLTSVTFMFLGWKKLSLIIKTTGSLTYGFSAIMKCWHLCVILCKCVQADEWRPEAVPWRNPPNSYGYTFAWETYWVALHTYPDNACPRQATSKPISAVIKFESWFLPLMLTTVLGLFCIIIMPV